MATGRLLVTMLAASLSSLVVHRVPAQTVRLRLVGVFNARSGIPVEGAEVVDLTTHGVATTPKTGIIGLALGDTTGTFVSVRKLGYSPEVLLIATGIRDTAPVTVVLRPAEVLPAVVTKSRASPFGAADTVRQLQLNGFYDRRKMSGAPSSAFLTAEKIGPLTLVSDAVALSGRPICSTNLYLDGVRVVDLATQNSGMKLRPSRGLRSQPIDQLVNPNEVLAIEFYRTGDAPVEYNATRPNGAPDCGVTLVWTK